MQKSIPIAPTVVAPNKHLLAKPRTTSDLNTQSQSMSTAGTKSGVDVPTQSIRGSITNNNFGEDLSLIEGLNSRNTGSGRAVSNLFYTVRRIYAANKKEIPFAVSVEFCYFAIPV